MMSGSSVLSFVREHGVDLVVVGPEAPLVAGVADAVLDYGIPVFGPTKDAARLEASKSFAKQVMADAGVATARASRAPRWTRSRPRSRIGTSTSCASTRKSVFLTRLKDVSDPETKRKIIGEEFIRVFEEEGQEDRLGRLSGSGYDLSRRD